MHTLLLRAAHKAKLQAQLQGLGSELNSPRQLQLNLHLDDQPQIALHSNLQAQADALQWSGELEVTALQDMAWLAEWLSEWTLLEADALPATPRQAGMNAQWQLQVPQIPLRSANCWPPPGGCGSMRSYRSLGRFPASAWSAVSWRSISAIPWADGRPGV